MTMFGLSAGIPSASRRLRQRRLSASPAEHRRLARAGRRAARRLVLIRGVPQAGQDVDAARLERRGLRVLVLVDHVLVEALGHQTLGLWLHPRRHERRHVEARVAVEHELVVDDLVRHVRRHLVLGERVPWDALSLERVKRRNQEVRGLPQLLHLMFDGHRSHSPFRVGGCGARACPGRQHRLGGCAAHRPPRVKSRPHIGKRSLSHRGYCGTLVVLAATGEELTSP